MHGERFDVALATSIYVRNFMSLIMTLACSLPKKREKLLHGQSCS